MMASSFPAENSAVDSVPDSFLVSVGSGGLDRSRFGGAGAPSWGSWGVVSLLREFILVRRGS